MNIELQTQAPIRNRQKRPPLNIKMFLWLCFLESDFAFSVIRSYWQARGWWLLMNQQSASVADKSTFFWLPMPTCLRVSLLRRNQTHPSECKCPNINWKHSHCIAHIKLPCLLISLVNVLRLPRFLLWIKSQEFSVWYWPDLDWHSQIQFLDLFRVR